MTKAVRPAPSRPSTRRPSQHARAGSPQAHRRDIQGLRAIAVLAVLLGHAKISGFSGGFVGVDVFFVISGFLITGILAREVTGSFRVRIAHFYVRRARRILPAATVTLIAIAIGSAVVYSAGDLEKVLGEVKCAALFAENICLATNGTGYFSTDTFISPVQHFWSLAVEEQFYLVWPAMIAFVVWSGRFRRRARLTRSFARVCVRRSAAAVVLVTFVSLVWSLIATWTQPQAAYFSPLTRVWELGAGAILALLADVAERISTRTRTLLSWAGLGLIALAVTAFSEQTPFPGVAAILPVAGTVMLLIGGMSMPRFAVGRLLGLQPFRFIGDISYSLYLWHWPVLILAAGWTGQTPAGDLRWILLGVSVVLGWLSYRYVEQPFRNPRMLSGHWFRPFVLWPATLTLITSVVVAVDFAVVGGRQQSVAKAQVVLAKKEQETTPATLRAEAQRAAGQARAKQPLPEQLLPDMTALFRDVTRAPLPCEDQATSTANNFCPQGDLKADRTIVVWGDSHALMWLKPIADLGAANNYKVIGFQYKTTCHPTLALTWYDDRPQDECLNYNRWVLDQIRRIKPDRIVIGGFAYRQYTDPTTRKPYPMDSADGARAYQNALATTMRGLGSLARRTYVLSDVQLLPQYAGRCLGTRRADRGTCAVPRDTKVAERSAAWRKVTASAGANWIDLVPYMCDAKTCPLVIGSIVVYRDSDHVTTTFARHLKPVFAEALGLSDARVRAFGG